MRAHVCSINFYRVIKMRTIIPQYTNRDGDGGGSGSGESKRVTAATSNKAWAPMRALVCARVRSLVALAQARVNVRSPSHSVDASLFNVAAAGFRCTSNQRQKTKTTTAIFLHAKQKIAIAVGRQKYTLKCSRLQIENKQPIYNTRLVNVLASCRSNARENCALPTN